MKILDRNIDGRHVHFYIYVHIPYDNYNKQYSHWKNKIKFPHAKLIKLVDLRPNQI